MEDSSQQTSTPKPSPNNSSKWVKWHAKQLDTLAWWQELSEVPSQRDVKEFVRRVCASFQLPKVSSHAQGVTNDYSALLAPHSLDRDQFLPIQDIWFRGQDFWLKQPQKTMAYAKVLQYWAEKTQPLTTGKSHQLAESLLELQCEMEPLVMFTDKEVLEELQPSNWVRITPSRTFESVDPLTSWEWSCSRNCRAQARGSFVAACGIGWLKCTATTQVASPSAISTQKVESQQEDIISQWWTAPPGFMEIARSLHGDNSPHVVWASLWN